METQLNCKYGDSNGNCWNVSPNSKFPCEGKCKEYTEITKEWDDKFGFIGKISSNELDRRLAESDGTMKIGDKYKKMIEGVGKDAEIITNEKGGKQSKSPMAMHLVDPLYLENTFKDLADKCEYIDRGGSTCVDSEDMEKHACYKAIEHTANFMCSGTDYSLTLAMDSLYDDEIQQVINIAKILQYGAERYAPNNWRLIPQEEHINHALIHLMAHLAGDTQDDHINHALCRLMMAKATEKSENFDYCNYLKAK